MNCSLVWSEVLLLIYNPQEVSMILDHNCTTSSSITTVPLLHPF